MLLGVRCCIVGTVGSRFLKRKKTACNKIGDLSGFAVLIFENLFLRQLIAFPKPGAYIIHNATGTQIV